MIIADSSSLFRYENFEEFYRNFYRISKKNIFIESPFREIYLITKEDSHKNVFIPLKGVTFLSDCYAFDTFVREEIRNNLVPNSKIELFCASLYLSGYKNASITMRQDEFGIQNGAWEMYYSDNENNVRDKMTFFDSLDSVPIKDVVSEFKNSTLEHAKNLLKKRSDVFSILGFSLPIKNA